MSLVFISSGAGWNNTIGYFTYPTNEVPTESTVQKILAFPNASPISKSSGTGRLLCGHEMKRNIGMKVHSSSKINSLPALL